MVASKKQSTWLILLSVLQVIVGVILLILCKFLFDALLALAGSHKSVSAPSISIWWIIGMPPLVPAIAGFVAVAIKKKFAIGLYMALNIIAMVVSGVFAILSMMYLVEMMAVGGISCEEVMGKCYCSAGNDGGTSLSDLGHVDERRGGPIAIDVDDCGSLNKVFGMMYGVTAMIVMGWFLCLTASIVCCAACCCAPAAPSVMYVQPDTFVAPIQTTYPVGPMPPAYEPVPMGEAEEMTAKENFRYNRMP